MLMLVNSVNHRHYHYPIFDLVLLLIMWAMSCKRTFSNEGSGSAKITNNSPQVQTDTSFSEKVRAGASIINRKLLNFAYIFG